VKLSLATSVSASDGADWAVVQLGTSAKDHNNFWELFVRPAGATAAWKLATPAGVASNGGLVAAPAADQAGRQGALAAGFQPSQDLTFSPVTATTDDGVRWSQGAPLAPGLADRPDALAAGAAGRLLAVTRAGNAELSTNEGASWTKLATARSLAATAAGRGCRPTEITGAALTAAGVPVLAATCQRPGAVGLFAQEGGSWRLAGPVLPAALRARGVSVLRLVSAQDRMTAVLAAGSGADAGIVTAWLPGAAAANGQAFAWQVSPVLRASPASLRSVAVWGGGTVGLVRSDGRTETGAVLARPDISAAGARTGWQSLRTLPAGTQTLATGSAGQPEALTAAGGTLTIWQFSRQTGAWTKAQTVRVQIPYGSSG
jgi:hypothetical protein